MVQGVVMKVAEKKNFQVAIILFITLLFSMMFAQGAFAHASIEQAYPSADSQLDTSPAKIELAFNERLEKELYFIHVFDQSGQKITQNATQMSTDQTKISLNLPPLKEGLYTVTYHIISADGHPVEQSYVFSVGVASKGVNANFLDEGHQHGSVAYYINRCLYYFGLLFLTGWLFWGICFPFSEKETRKEYDFWLDHLKHFYLLMILGMGFIQFSILLSGFSLNRFLSVLTGTTFGLTWAFSLLLSLAGYVILRRNKWLDGLWIVLLLIAEGINGHSISFHPQVLTVLLDILHLAGASIWAGGLLMLILIWRKYRDSMKGFLPLFSKWAFLSIIMLMITGVFSAFLFLPKWSYLLDTTWGYLLIAKTILVILVLAVAGRIRVKMKKQAEEKSGHLLKWDFSLMLTIIGVVGVLTYQSPLPANQPLFWHQMEPGIMVTTQITPNAPGTNQFHVEVELNRKNTQLKHIELFLKNRDKELAPISIPLKLISSGETQGDFGFKEYRYSSEGPYLPFAGDWTIEVRILDSNDDETVYTKDFTIY